MVHFPLRLIPVDIAGHITYNLHENLSFTLMYLRRQMLAILILGYLISAVLFLHIVETLVGSCIFSCFIFILILH
jgi:hypothetical protein